MTKGGPRHSLPRPEAEKLKVDPGFELILELNFGDMISFVLSNIKRKSIVSLFYVVINGGLLVFILIFLVNGLMVDAMSWSTLLKQCIIGIFSGSFLIIPLHEMFHGMAYRILGARKIRFGADMQQLIFYVTADRYPVSGNELFFLALLPFVAINIMSVLIFILLFPQWILFGTFLLLSHNIMCIGDFAIVNYVYHIPGKVYTFDRMDERKSYFFVEVTNQKQTD